MANLVLIPLQGRIQNSIASDLDSASLHMQQLMATLEQSWWESLKSNFHDTFFPEKLPPLKLTSRPVRVREIWGDYNHRKSATVGTTIVHAFMVAGLIAISIVGARAVKQELKPQTVVDLVAPNVSVYMPISNKPNDTIGGGGGGGDRD